MEPIVLLWDDVVALRRAQRAKAQRIVAIIGIATPGCNILN